MNSGRCGVNAGPTAPSASPTVRLLAVASSRRRSDLLYFDRDIAKRPLLPVKAGDAAPSRPDVAGAGADQLALGGLLDGVGHPADSAAHGERRREQRTGQPGGGHHHAGEELDVARQRAVRLEPAERVEDAALDVDGDV